MKNFFNRSVKIRLEQTSEKKKHLYMKNFFNRSVKIRLEQTNEKEHLIRKTSLIEV